MELETIYRDVSEIRNRSRPSALNGYFLNLNRTLHPNHSTSALVSRSYSESIQVGEFSEVSRCVQSFAE